MFFYSFSTVNSFWEWSVLSRPSGMRVFEYGILIGNGIHSNNILIKELKKLEMEDRTFKISFESDGKTYEGMVNHSERMHDDGRPASFHVILNHVNFGNLSFDRNRWLVDEQRPAQLIEHTGRAIEVYYKRSDAIATN